MIDTNVLNASKIENDFKMAQVMKIQQQTDRAIKKFKDVCFNLEAIIKHNPGATTEIHFIPLSLGELSEIFKERRDLNKALAFVKCQRKFLEYIHSNRPHHENEYSGEGTDEPEFPEHNLSDLFEEMHKAFEKEGAPPERDPQDVVKLIMEAQKKQEQETAKKNLEKLQQLVAERKKRLEESRWEQTLEWVNDHPIRVAFGAIVFLLIFITIAINSFNFEDLDPGKDLRKLREEAALKAKLKGENGPQPENHEHHHHDHEPPKMSEAELKEIQEMMNKLKDEQKQREIEMLKKKQEKEL